MLSADGPARRNKTRPHIVAALKREGGATLGELTVASGWRAPFGLLNLRTLARKANLTIVDDGAASDARRYRVEG